MADNDMSGMTDQQQYDQQVQDSQAQQSEDGGQNQVAQIAAMISEIDRRLRVLEERYSNLRKKMNITDHNLIESERSFTKEVHGFNDDIMSLKRNINDFDEKIAIFGTEMENVANKTELKVIEKYLAMWNPATFVTRKELREYLKTNPMKLREDQD